MKIAIDASRANAQHKTGIEWYAYFLIQEFKKIATLRPARLNDVSRSGGEPQDDNLEIILYSGSELKGNLAQLPKGWTSKVLRWPLRYIWTHIRLCFEVWKNPPDVLFIPAHTIPLFIKKKVKVVTTIHDMGFMRFPKSYHPLTVPYHIFSVWLAKRRADKIITVSDFSKSEIQQFFKIPDEKIVVTHLGYDARQYNTYYSDKVIGDTLEKFNIHPPYFLYVGRIEKKKNSLRMIQAFAKVIKKHPGITLVFPGTLGYGAKEVDEEIKHLDIGRSIRALGYVPSCDIAALYAGAEAFIFPSIYEGFGIPVLEAMGAGTPVLTAKAASLPEIAGDAALYVDPYDVDDMAKKMIELFENRELRQELIQKGAERVKQFSWEKTATETWNILKS